MSDPLFQGMTRPAMLAGVTYSGVMLELMLVSIPFIAINNLLVLLAIIPVHGVLWLLCRWDARAIDILLVWLRTGGQARLRHLWQGSTYRP
jgi:type IV secretion system protein VirB3